MLTGSVGQGGQNRHDDVLVVQLLLNDFLGQRREATLKLDGIIGPKTNAAIAKFQRLHATARDGRIDRDGPTIKKLTSLHLESVRGKVQITAHGARFLRHAQQSNDPPHEDVFVSRIQADRTSAMSMITSLFRSHIIR